MADTIKVIIRKENKNSLKCTIIYKKANIMKSRIINSSKPKKQMVETQTFINIILLLPVNVF